MRLDRWLVSGFVAVLGAGRLRHLERRFFHAQGQRQGSGAHPYRARPAVPAARASQGGAGHADRRRCKFDDDYAPAHTVIATITRASAKTTRPSAITAARVELEPKNGDTNNNLGVFLCRIGKVDQALPYFETAVHDPFYDTKDVALANAGRCLLKKNDYPAAEREYRRALAINPVNADALYQLASVLYTEGQGFPGPRLRPALRRPRSPKCRVAAAGLQDRNPSGRRGGSPEL